MPIEIDLSPLYGAAGGIVLGYLVTELFFSTMTVLSRVDLFPHSNSGGSKHDKAEAAAWVVAGAAGAGTALRRGVSAAVPLSDFVPKLVGSLRARYRPIMALFVPLNVAWIVFGCFSAMFMVAYPGTIQSMSVLVFVCASAALGVLYPAATLFLRKRMPRAMTDLFPLPVAVLFVLMLLWMGLAVRLIDNGDYPLILLSVVLAVPAVWTFWTAGMLWLTYAMRNAMICGGWDPQVSQTTRKCSAFLSWILVPLRFVLVVGAIVFTANEIAGLVTGLKDGYYDRQIDDALVALAAPVGARLVVSVVIRLAPMLWLVVQPSMLTELFLALDAHRAVTSIDHDDVRAGGDGTRRLVFELFPPARSTMLSAVLFSMPVFTYASVVLVLEIVRQVVKRNLASTTLLVDLTLIKLEDLSFTLRYVEMISLAVAFIVRLFLRRGDRVMIWLTKASRGTQDAVIGHTLRIMHAVHSKRENEIVDREQEPITMGQLFEPQHLVNVGFLYAALRDHKRAEQMYRLAIDSDKNFSLAWYLLGESLAALNRLPAAQQAHEEAIRLNPQNKHALCALGVVHFKQQRFNEAVDMFGRALKLDDSFAKVWTRMAQLFYQTRDFGEAMAAAEKAVILDDRDTLSRINLCHIYARLGYADKYQGMIAHLLGSYGGDVTVLERVADLRIAEDADYDSAIDLYGRIVSLGHMSYSIIDKYASALRDAGRQSEAVDLIEEYLDELDSNPSLSITMQSELRLRWLLAQWYDDDSSEYAVSQLQYILGHSPQLVGPISVQLGKRFIQLARLVDSEKALYEALERNPRDPDALFYMGLTRSLMSRPADEFANEFELSLATKFTAYRCGIWLNETRLAERLTTEWMEEIIDLLQARRVAEPFEIDCAFGSAFHAMGDSTLALRFYEEALRVQRDPTVLHDMACLLLQNNQIEYAEKALRASLRIRDDPYVLHNMVLALKLTRREAEARAAFSMLIDRHPELDLVYEEIDGVAFPLTSLFYQMFTAFGKLQALRELHAERFRLRAQRAEQGDTADAVGLSPPGTPLRGRRGSIGMAMGAAPSSPSRAPVAPRGAGSRHGGAPSDALGADEGDEGDDDAGGGARGGVPGSPQGGARRRTKRLDRLRSMTSSADDELNLKSPMATDEADEADVRLTRSGSRSGGGAAQGVGGGVGSATAGSSGIAAVGTGAGTGVHPAHADLYDGLSPDMLRKLRMQQALIGEFKKRFVKGEEDAGSDGTLRPSESRIDADPFPRVQSTIQAIAQPSSEGQPLAADNFPELGRPRVAHRRRGGLAAAAAAAGATSMTGHSVLDTELGPEQDSLDEGHGAPGRMTGAGRSPGASGDQRGSGAAGRTPARDDGPVPADAVRGPADKFRPMSRPKDQRTNVLKKGDDGDKPAASAPSTAQRPSRPAQLAAPAPAAPVVEISPILPISPLAAAVSAGPSAGAGGRAGGPPPPPPPGLLASLAGAAGKGGPPPPPPGLLGNLSQARSAPSGPRLKQFHWNKIPMNRLNQTIWGQAGQKGGIVLDTKELEELFAVQPSNSAAAPRPEAQQAEVKSLIAVKKGTNVAIALAKIPYPYAEIREAVETGDDLKLTDQNLEALLKTCVPTQDEAAAIKRYKGDFARLSEADRFFAEVVHVTLFAERVELMLFRAEFRETVTHCRRQMSIINMAAVQTKSSHRFTRLLEVILQLGNMLNERGNAGVAQGFRLDSLLKMADTRASNSNMTLLHYLVRLLDAKMPELNDFFNDMPNVEPASKLPFGVVKSEVQSLNERFARVRIVLDQLRANGSSTDEVFITRFQSFQQAASADVDLVNRELGTLQQNFGAVAAYFGEEPEDVNSEDFFSNLASFVRLFKGARREFEQRNA